MVICFDKLGRGALVGCAESKTNPQGLNTVIRKTRGKKLKIDIDGLRSTTKYNNTFENPKEFYYTDFNEKSFNEHIEESLDLCLYHLELSKTSLNINKRVNAQYAKEETVFKIENIEDARERKATSIAIRRGQKKFREYLIKAYNGKCAVTNSGTLSVLEAAHIIPYKGESTNYIQNGILLRSDIHTLFDLGLLTINSETFEIILHNTLIKSEYSKFKKLILPKNKNDYPDPEALKWHNENEFKK